MDIVKSLALAVLLLATPAFANELSSDLIRHADEMRESAQMAIGLGLIERPDQDWIDVVHAYYLALNVAWAYKDEKEYEAFYLKLQELYADLVEDFVAPEEPEAPKTEL